MYYNKDGGPRRDNAEESARGKKEEGATKLFTFVQYNIFGIWTYDSISLLNNEERKLLSAFNVYNILSSES